MKLKEAMECLAKRGSSLFYQSLQQWQINPDAICWHIRLGGSVPVGMGQIKQGKCNGSKLSVLVLSK
ncbi:hypothetical protein [Microbulbifer sp. YPW16]|uniref:hypothetical protein n=1 Tax=Microbulbifer sp. YPW16 TaxID=2904242 RepID=UPI001E429331|nr:hypothetical protein [Microbulbifer sp. YPW16]UHQ55426.1 hypothetical protein LVE68_00110 [Microbulbifer sp. YPW16]